MGVGVRRRTAAGSGAAERPVPAIGWLRLLRSVVLDGSTMLLSDLAQGRPARHLRTWCAAVVVGAVLAVSGAVPAAAHNALTGSSPGRDAVVASVPGAVVLTFDEPAIGLGTRVVVTGPQGEVQQGPPRLVDNTVTQPLQPAAAAGAYTVAWRVTSIDGHPISGTYAFTATEAGSSPPVAAGEPEGAAGDRITTGVMLVLAATVVLLLLPLGILGWRRRHPHAEPGAERSQQ